MQTSYEFAKAVAAAFGDKARVAELCRREVREQFRFFPHQSVEACISPSILRKHDEIVGELVEKAATSDELLELLKKLSL